MTTLLIAQNTSDIPLLHQWTQVQKETDFRFFAMTSSCAETLRRLNYPCLSYAEVSNASYRNEKIAASERLAATWYQHAGPGVNLGEIVFRDFNLFLRSLFEIANLILGALDQGKFSRCVAVSSSDPVSGLRMKRTEHLAAEVAALICKERGIPFQSIESPAKSENSSDFKTILKSFVAPITNYFQRKALKNQESKDSKQAVLFSGGLQQLGDLVQAVNQEKDLRPIFLRDIWSFDYTRRFNQLNVRFLTASFKPLRQAVSQQGNLDSFFVYRGINFLPVVSKRLEFLDKKFFPQLRGLEAQLRDILAKHRIRLLVVDEDVCEFNKMLVSIGKEMGIPSLMIQHGAPGLPQGFHPSTATRIAAWGELTVQKFSEWGIDPAKIKITGVSKYDKLLNAPLRTKNPALLQSLGLTPEKTTVLVCPGISAANPFEKFYDHVSSFEENIAMIRETLQAVGGREDFQILVKLHQRDRDEASIREMIEKAQTQAKVIVVKDADTLALLQTIDLLIVSYSSVAVEAMLLDVPIITTNFSGQPDLMPYAEYGGAVGVYKSGELRSAIEMIFRDKELQVKLRWGRQNFLEKFIYKLDGQSTDRILKVFRELIR